MSVAAPAPVAESTRRLILAAALEHLEQTSVPELTMRAVASRAGLSERTVFRYFATREEFLEAVAEAVSRALDLPAAPHTLDALPGYAEALYRRFEAKAALTQAALHTEIFSRMRDTQARVRWEAIQRLVDQQAPLRDAQARAVAAANMRYFLSATTWHYYRANFGFELDATIECARTAITQAIDGLMSHARS